MELGVWLRLTERHEHEHIHHPMTHTHPHVHDVHHRHQHGSGWSHCRANAPINSTFAALSPLCVSPFGRAGLRPSPSRNRAYQSFHHIIDICARGVASETKPDRAHPDLGGNAHFL